jgi:CBS domain-containing protein
MNTRNGNGNIETNPNSGVDRGRRDQGDSPRFFRSERNERNERSDMRDRGMGRDMGRDMNRGMGGDMNRGMGGDMNRGMGGDMNRDQGMRDQRQAGGRRWRRGRQTAADIMTKSPRTARPNDMVQQVAEIMVAEDCGIVPICEQNGRLVGVVTDRDIVCRLVAHGIDMRSAKVSDVMTDDVECVTEDEPLDAVLRLMAQHQVRRIPVVARGDRLVGIIAMADIAREADADDELQDAFEEISSERSFWSRLR